MNQINRKWIPLLTLCSALCLANASRGATYTWTGGSDNWTNAASWGGTVPTSADVAQLNNGSTITVNSAGPTAAHLNTTNGTVEVTTGGALALTGTGTSVSLTLAGGNMLISGGAVTVNVVQNNFIGSGSSLTITSGSYSGTAYNRLGDKGSGTLTVSGTGSYSGGRLIIATDTGTVNLTGSSASITGLSRLDATGGTNNFNLTLGSSGINAIATSGNFNLLGNSTLSLNLLDYDVATYGQTVNLFTWTGSVAPDSNWDTININGTSLGFAIDITANSTNAFTVGDWSGNIVVDTTSATRRIYLSDLQRVP